MWKHVQEMKGSGKDVVARIIASSFVVKNRELQEMRKTFGLKDAADLARKIHHVCDPDEVPPMCIATYQLLLISILCARIFTHSPRTQC